MKRACWPQRLLFKNVIVGPSNVLALLILFLIIQTDCLSKNFTNDITHSSSTLDHQNPDSLLYNQSCQSDVDFRTWVQEGVLDNGNWEVSVDPVSGIGRSVYQTINHDPTFYVSPDTFMNVRMRGTIRIEDYWDNDFVGFVFGYLGPNQFISKYEYDFLLFDWKQENQIQEQREGKEGMALSRVKGDLNGFENMYNHFWQHDDEPGKFEVIDQLWGPKRGWEYNTDYDFEIVYTSTLIQIYINKQLVFDVPGCYQAGRFGFYNFSQQDVRYSDFTYELESNFIPAPDVCLGQPSQFIFSDTCSSIDNTTANLEMWRWDFGDGSTSEEVNPSHTYKHPGTYTVTLWVMDKNGCTDESVKKVNVLPGPSLPTFRDSTLCEGRSITLEVPAEKNTTYTWQDGTKGTSYTISFPGEYYVEADNGVCTRRSDTRISFVGPIEKPDLGPDRLLCEGSTIMLDGSVPGATKYWWQDGNRDSTYEVSAPGQYRVIAANICGFKRDTIEVIGGTAPEIGLLDDASICEGETAVLSANVLPNDLPSAIIWNTGSQTADISVSPSDTTSYEFQVTNTCGADTGGMRVFVHPLVEFTYDMDSVSCAGMNDGSINLEVTRSTGQPTYVWSPQVSTTSRAANLRANTYTIEVSDEQGCASTQRIVIPEPEPLNLNHSVTPDNSCLGDVGGEANITVSGGVGGYEFSLDGGAYVASAVFSGLEPGTYDITVRDAAACLANSFITVSPPPPALDVLPAQIVDVNCNGEDNGRIEIQTQGGVAPYRFSIENFATNTTGIFTGLRASQYQIEISDARGCTDTVEVELNEPEALRLSPQLDSIVCAGNAQGAISMDASGGSGDFEYEWVPPVSNGPNASNLMAGTYQVSVTDERGCSTSRTINLEEPVAISVEPILVRDVSCNGLEDGLVILEAEGGAGKYTFSLDGSTYVEESTFSGLGAGNYSIAAKDEAGCIEAVSFTINEPPTPVIGNVLDSDNVSCFGEQDGRIALEATGGSGPYVFTLDSAESNFTGIFETLRAGTYEVEVKDTRDCISIVEVELEEPPVLEGITNLDQPIYCHGDRVGQVSVEVIGGTEPYRYTWSNGTVGSPTINGLGAGLIGVEILDANGCLTSSELRIDQPDPLLASLESLNSPKCYEEANGRITVATTGGYAPYEYFWNDPSLPNLAVLDSLPAGNYNVRVVDSMGCETNLQGLQLIQPQQILLDATSTDVSCFGGADGRIALQASGGTGSLQARFDGQDIPIQGVAGLQAGAYTVQVKDAEGCIMEQAVQIMQPDPLVLELDNVSDAFCNLPNGSAMVFANGGNGSDYKYRWNTNPPQFLPLGTDLAEGVYEVTATDEMGCETTTKIRIGGSLPPVADFTHSHFAKDSILLREASFSFTNMSVRATSYEWDFGDGSPKSMLENPVHTFPDTGTYTIVLTAFDPNNTCPDVDSLQVRVFHGGRLFVPNAFTPNADGKNDIWYVIGIGVTQIEVIIFDRWGLEITRLHSLETGWDGRNRHGRDVQEGVYVFLLNATLNTGEKVRRAGTITLIR